MDEKRRTFLQLSPLRNVAAASPLAAVASGNYPLRQLILSHFMVFKALRERQVAHDGIGRAMTQGHRPL
jgi:hypothetical protein